VAREPSGDRPRLDIVGGRGMRRAKTMSRAKLTWERCVEIEPRLLELEREILEVDDTAEDFCANAVWYGNGLGPGRGYGHGDSFKERVVRFAGWHGEHEELGTPVAYELVYQHLYSLLPPCRGCLCA
jgi:hypothetical protein